MIALRKQSPTVQCRGFFGFRANADPGSMDITHHTLQLPASLCLRPLPQRSIQLRLLPVPPQESLDDLLNGFMARSDYNIPYTPQPQIARLHITVNTTTSWFSTFSRSTPLETVLHPTWMSVMRVTLNLRFKVRSSMGPYVLSLPSSPQDIDINELCPEFVDKALESV